MLRPRKTLPVRVRSALRLPPSVASCYGQLGQYKEGFQLAKRMLEGQINDSEREDLLQHYVLNGYVYGGGGSDKSDESDG